jgi:hypothetical protein
LPKTVSIERRMSSTGTSDRTWPTQRFACIVGAPRCGTTTLARLLESHPDVSFSSVKEPHYFALFDLNGLDDAELKETVGDEYLARYFSNVDPGSTVMAEGSVSYLYAPERLLPLLRIWPDAKFIIAVRDPLEQLPSFHQRLLYQTDENVADFEKAWRLIEDRRAGRKIPWGCIDPRQLQYDEVARFGKHVGRFFDVIGRDRCHVVVFDDLKADPEKAFADLLSFLDLPPAPLPADWNPRPRRGFKIGWLQRLLKRPPFARSLLAGEKFRKRIVAKPNKKPSRVSRAVMATRKALLEWNRTPPPRVQLRPSFVKEIRETLSDDVAKLSGLLDRDLSHWLGAKSAKDPSYDRAA